jgi:hypothetical protein
LPKELLNKSCEGLRNGQMHWWKWSITMEVQEYIYLKYGIDWKTTMSKDNPELGRDQATIADVLKTQGCIYLHILGMELGPNFIFLVLDSKILKQSMGHCEGVLTGQVSPSQASSAGSKG